VTNLAAFCLKQNFLVEKLTFDKVLKTAGGKDFSKLKCFVIRFVNWCYTLKRCTALCFMRYRLKCWPVKGFVEYTINLAPQEI